jgi:hypothetical protein
MRQLQRAGVESSDDAQGFPSNDVLGVLAPNLGLESVHHPCLGQTLHTLRHRALQNDVEGIFIVAGGQHLSLTLARVTESPGLVVEDSFAPGFATTRG